MTSLMQRIDRYYDGDSWPHDCLLGVGVRFEGKPADARRFLDILHEHSCSPPAARRILAVLDAGEVKYTTLTDTLPFNRIGDALAELGVAMKVVPPQIQALPTNLDSEVLATFLGLEVMPLEDETHNQVVKERVKEFSASMAALPHSLGRYEWMRKSAA